MRSRATRTVLSAMSAAAVLLIVSAWGLTELWRDVFVNLGAGLAGAVVTFLIFEVYLRELRRSEGITRKGFEYAPFIKSVRTARETVRVLTTFTYLLSDSHTRHQFRNALYDALRARPDLSVRFLVLDPFSDAARQRERDRGDGEKVILLIQQNLIELYELTQDPVFRSVEVRIYDLLPPISLFQWDYHGSMSFYPRGRSISEADRFELSIETPLGRFVNDTFENIWKDVQSQHLEDYMHLPVQVVNPLTNEAEEHRVPFVKEQGQLVFYALLNRHDHKWGWAVSETLPLRVVWKGTAKEFSVTELRADAGDVHAHQHVVDWAVRKYGRIEFQKIVLLRRES